MYLELLNVFGPVTPRSSYDNTKNDILINGLDKFEGNYCNVTIVCTILTSDWFKQQNFRFQTSFLVTKFGPSLNNTEILSEEHVIWQAFFATVMVGRNLLIQRNTLSKWSLNVFYFVNFLSAGLCILCLQMKPFVCGEGKRSALWQKKLLGVFLWSWSFYFQGEISFREGYFDDAELRYALRI